MNGKINKYVIKFNEKINKYVIKFNENIKQICNKVAWKNKQIIAVVSILKIIVINGCLNDI